MCPVGARTAGARSTALQLTTLPYGCRGVLRRRLPCPAAGTPEATAAGLQFDPNQPYGATNYCINTAIQFYDEALTPLGYNLRLSPHTWDPQLSAPHPGCICNSTTFIGDYFGVGASNTATYTTSVSTDNDGRNPSNYQQQIVSATPTP